MNDGLQFCLETMPDEFQGAQPTIKFLKVFNDLFDIMNSMSFGAQIPLKRPLNSTNAEKVFAVFDEAEKYIRGLYLPILDKKNGTSNNESGRVEESRGLTKIIHSQRKTGFGGFLAAIQSLRELYERLVLSPDIPIDFISTYKLCQDSIERFFGVIRAYGRGNNNPSAMLFAAAWRSLLLHNELRDVANGNCTNLDNIPVLNFSSCKTAKTKKASFR